MGNRSGRPRSRRRKGTPFLRASFWWGFAAPNPSWILHWIGTVSDFILRHRSQCLKSSGTSETFWLPLTLYPSRRGAARLPESQLRTSRFSRSHMKSEERHKLQQNELADWLGRSYALIKPYANAILAVVLLAAVIVGLTALVETAVRQRGVRRLGPALRGPRDRPYRRDRQDRRTESQQRNRPLGERDLRRSAPGSTAAKSCSPTRRLPARTCKRPSTNTPRSAAKPATPCSASGPSSDWPAPTRPSAAPASRRASSTRPSRTTRSW